MDTCTFVDAAVNNSSRSPYTKSQQEEEEEEIDLIGFVLASDGSGLLQLLGSNLKMHSASRITS
jgi:hypothetical protein